MGSNLAKRAMPLGGLKKLPYFLLTTCYRAKTERKTPKQKQPFAFTMSKGIQSIKKDPRAPYKIPLCVYIAASITDDDDCKKTLIGACDETDFIKVIHVANSESKTSSMTKMDVDRWYMLKNFSVHVRKLNQLYLMTNEKCTVRKTFRSAPPANDIQRSAKQLVSPFSCERTFSDASTTTELSTVKGEIIEVRYSNITYV